MRLFTYLHYGLSAVLVFVGRKMLISGFYIIPTWVSLLVIVALLAVAVIASLLLVARHGAPGKALPTAAF
jgi:tellurite resistance protein TerC